MNTVGDFFIVDNSDEEWKALEYLRQWASISRGLDVATGHFEIGALIALDGEWQKIPEIRLLIGGETSRTTSDAIRAAAKDLDESLVDERGNDAFLRGVPAVVEAIKSGQIQIRVYRKKKFHAKAYITHGNLDVIGSAALVGSSNFTRPGLTRNVELNVRFTGVEVRELQSWYEAHWNDAEPAHPELLTVLEKYVRPITPFEVYLRALQTLTEGVGSAESEWESNESTVFPKLAPYQRDAYLGLKQRARSWGGGFLTDGVGLGKTFVGLMLAEYYAVRERKNVLILATKTGKDAVWEPLIRKLLPNLRGDFTNLKVMAHTDLSTRDAMEQVEFLAQRADVVIVDEAHNFRNLGVFGPDPLTPKSRWYRLARICKDKTTFLLTATPINNTLFDFVHELQLFTGIDRDSYFSDLGIPSLRQYVAHLERSFTDAGSHDVDLADFEKLLSSDKLLETMIVQNSRAYAVASSMVQGEVTVVFPEQLPPKAVPYDYDLNYASLLSELEQAFKKDAPLFVLPMYYPLSYSLDEQVDRLVENRQKQVVGLIRTVFLKRFESSIAAFAGSCLDMAQRIVDWIEQNASSVDGGIQRLHDWQHENETVIRNLQALFRKDALDAEDESEDLALPEEGEVPDLDPSAYRMPDMLNDAFADLAQMSALLRRCLAVGVQGDTKYEQLKKLLLTGAKKNAPSSERELFDPAFQTQKVLVFTEFADTARYLFERLTEDGLVDVDRIDGSRKSDRVAMIKRFSPFYNEVPEEERRQIRPLRVLISTDVLSEGVNLQDATRIVNYDIHWNPVRLMQRIGRVDRRLNPEIEEGLCSENPDALSVRGKIAVRNFLPNAQLNGILNLYTRVQSRVLLISKTLGIPGGKLLDESDMLDDTRVFEAFLHDYLGEMSPLEQLRLKLLAYLNEDPGLAERLKRLATGTFSAMRSDKAGIFICSLEPTRIQTEDGEVVWTRSPGKAHWHFHPSEGPAISGLLEIDALIACNQSTPAVAHPDKDLTAKRIKESGRSRYEQLLKEQMPLDAPTLSVDCWMELTP